MNNHLRDDSQTVETEKLNSNSVNRGSKRGYALESSKAPYRYRVMETELSYLSQKYILTPVIQWTPIP